MCAKQRVALYGGTFDPVHQGHLEIAHKVSQLFEIEKVILIPAHAAPHKLDRRVTSPFHRYAMLAMATQDDLRLEISTVELEAPHRPYTVDTIDYFQQTLGATSDLFFIMGADSWSEITTWREWQRLLTMSNHIVVTRPGCELIEAYPEVRDRIVDLRANDLKEVDQLPAGFRIFFTDVVMKDVSATRIRSLVSAGRFDEIVELVPVPVAEYLKKYRIY